MPHEKARKKCYCKFFISKHLVNCRDNNIEECGLELDFTMDFEVLGKVDTIELKEGGSDIAVTEENKEEYIRYVLSGVLLFL